MSGQVTLQLDGADFTLDSSDGLCISVGEYQGAWLSRRDAQVLLDFLKFHLEPNHEQPSRLIR